MTQEEYDLFNDLFGLLRMAEDACRQMRLRGDNSSLSHETRMFAMDFGEGGASRTARRRIKEVCDKGTPT